MLSGNTGEPNPEFLEPPAADRELHQMKADLREMIDVVGIPSVFRGQEGARQPGYSISQLISASQMIFGRSSSTFGGQGKC